MSGHHVLAPSETAALLFVGGSYGAALATALQNHLAIPEWAWVPGPGPIRAFASHAQATSVARYVVAQRPSEGLEANRLRLIATLRRCGVRRAWLSDAIAHGVDTPDDCIELVIEFVEELSAEFEWFARVGEIAAAVYREIAWPCDVVESLSDHSEHHVLLFDFS